MIWIHGIIWSQYISKAICSTYLNKKWVLLRLDKACNSHACTCTIKSSCGILVVITKRKCKDEVLEFLNSLSEQYSNVKCLVLLMDLIPTTTKTISYVKTGWLRAKVEMGQFRFKVETGWHVPQIRRVALNRRSKWVDPSQRS